MGQLRAHLAVSDDPVVFTSPDGSAGEASVSMLGTVALAADLDGLSKHISRSIKSTQTKRYILYYFNDQFPPHHEVLLHFSCSRDYLVSGVKISLSTSLML